MIKKILIRLHLLRLYLGISILKAFGGVKIGHGGFGVWWMILYKEVIQGRLTEDGVVSLLSPWFLGSAAECFLGHIKPGGGRWKGYF